MTQSIKLFTFLTFLACVMSSAAGQEDKLRQLENKVGQEWNRIQEYVALAHQAIAQDPEFELSDDQAIEFQNFLVEHEPLKQSLVKLGGNQKCSATAGRHDRNSGSNGWTGWKARQ